MVDATVSNGTTYYYYVTAVDTSTNESAASETASATPQASSSTTGISLSATGYKVKGTQHADLSWSGATSTNVDVFRNDVKVTTTANNGVYTDNIGNKGNGTYTSKVCEAGTSTCSGEVTVSFG